MMSTMMDEPLGTRLIVERGERLFADSLVQTFDGERLTSVPFASIAERARRLAAGLAAIGVGNGDRVATLCWNRQEHLEAYLAVPTMGAILHTVNVRLTAEQIGWILDDAEVKILLVDAELVSRVAPILAHRPALHAVVVVGRGESAIPNGLPARVLTYDELLAADPLARWPVLEERSAAAICYTSGTTGNPKGVVYSHRSIFLHSLASLGCDTFGISNADRILMIPAMFHANAWGMPYSGWLAGADMVMPGPHLQADKIAAMVLAARPTLTAAVPTILNDLLRLNQQSPIDLSSFRLIFAGGSAVSKQLIDRMKSELEVDIVQGWGMTETSPLCVLSHPPRSALPADESDWRSKSGRPVAGMEVRIVDDAGQAVAQDGAAVGRLQLRGPWVTGGYYRTDASPLSADGWLDSGDVGTIDRQGYVQITDRTKDLIKSGGEWISSIDLEVEIARLPGIADVAVVAIPDPRWEERPLAVVAGVGDAPLDFAVMRRLLAPKVARFMIPEYWTQVSDLPKTSVGKIDKRRLRDDARRGVLSFTREVGFGSERL